MKKWFSVDDEFYVGYLPDAPRRTRSVVRKAILIIVLLGLGTSLITSWQQEKFSTANFEYGVYTALEGTIFDEPVPHLLVPFGKDLQQNDVIQTVLLVGLGKMGADQFLQDITNTKKITMGSRVRLSGSLIYGDGKAILQVDEGSNIKLLGGPALNNSGLYKKEERALLGEVIDPKCYFGVMKPGEGKTHRACAIRCIAGGIPPVFKTDSGYVLLLNERNGPVAPEIAGIVGDLTLIQGVIVQWNDWTILQVRSETIQQLAAEKKWRQELISLEAGITLCN